MLNRNFLLTPFLFNLLIVAAPLHAEVLSSTSPTIRDNLCVGLGCATDETFAGLYDSVVIKGNNTRVVFEDNSTSSGFPTADWALEANETGSTGLERFILRNLTANTTPFVVEGDAPTSSLFVAADGDIGLGTSIPQADMHIVSDSSSPSLRLQSTSIGQAWQIGDPVSLNAGFQIYDVTADSTPFLIVPGGNNQLSFVINGEKIGLGTDAPQEKLHIVTNASNTDAFALFDANGAGSDAAFRLRQNGLIPTTWEFRNQQDSGRLNVGIAGGNTPLKIDNAANNNLIRLGRNGKPGEVNITGTLVVNNTQLNVPDYVFAHDYALRPLSEVQAFIDENSHLPDVPSAAEIAAKGVDMTAMQMTLLKKVEELTLYTLELEQARAGQDMRLAAQERSIALLQAQIDSLR
ncbi:hypothetical protein PVW51_21105 [Sulfitobacter sp. PR48]|uniref:hypothetical protein n=1 Tax=Sulfitobacter sp. PR48 TaxID=3028383 RepID=UPI00237B6772|nr:hypothetical protein [Sulfitobacter sp. PR48]MDD9723210.1 hypothetical protein [Sulfitobacter sp. PR48]